MMELREKVSEAIDACVCGRDVHGNIVSDLVGIDSASAAILAIPEIAEALEMRQSTIDATLTGTGVVRITRIAPDEFRPDAPQS